MYYLGWPRLFVPLPMQNSTLRDQFYSMTRPSSPCNVGAAMHVGISPAHQPLSRRGVLKWVSEEEDDGDEF
jgi:hypothetical protein